MTRLLFLAALLFSLAPLHAQGTAAYDYAVTVTKESFHWDHVSSGTPAVATTPRQVLTEQPANLTTINFNASQPALYQQRVINGQTMDCVLVATYTRYNSIWETATPGQDLHLFDPTGNYSIFPWVTVGDTLKDYLNTNYTLTPGDFDLRVAQSLGLPPSSAEQARGLAFFWAPVLHIERPAYTATISTQIDYASLPTNEDGTYLVNTPDAGGPGFVFQDYAYQYHDGLDGFGTFIQFNQATTHAPWTAMGYTYNWNYHMDGLDGRALDPDRVDSYVGVTEFVISAGSWVDFDHFVTHDNLYAYLIPEPGTLFLLVTSAGFVLLRQRRR